MNRHTQIRQAVLARLREQCGDSATFFDGLPAFIDAQELPAVAVWLSDAQYTGKMTDEDDWQAVLHIAVFIRAQAPDSELDMWMESTIFPALNDIPALSGLIDTLIPLGFNYQRDNEMATWAMAEITYQITYTNKGGGNDHTKSTGKDERCGDDVLDVYRQRRCVCEPFVGH